MLASFKVDNYRSFARPQEIEIRPLTLFFGWNSGGKSALLRFLPLISESIQVAGPPIWLGGDVGRNATWPSLVSKATGRGALTFSLSWAGEQPLSVEWKINGDLEGRWQEIESVRLGNLIKELPTGNWAGLLPVNESELPLSMEKSLLRKYLQELQADVQWISGIRTRPARVITYGGGTTSMIHSNGADAVHHLIAAQLRSTSDPLLVATNAFFSALGEQLVLDNPIDGVWRILVQPSNSPNVRVDLCDTGEGYSQVLPVLVALARARISGPRLLCLEQPELHLHTKAQMELATQLVLAATSARKPAVLVETHSEVLLTAVQLAIANGEIPAEDVKVYWVEPQADGTSDAVPVTFNSLGQPETSTLSDAFGEALRLGQRLLSIQLRSATK